MSMGLALIMALGAGASTDAAIRSSTEVVGAELRLGQALDLSNLPSGLRDKASNLVVAVLPAGRAQDVVSRARLLTRARAQMPVLGDWSPPEQSGDVVLRRQSGSGQAHPNACWRIVQVLNAGQPLTAASVEAVECSSSVEALVSYDARMGAPRARRALNPGDLTSGPIANAFPAIGAGQRVRLGVEVGFVRVEREVEALQSAREGQSFFARADDGSVFSSAGMELAR